MNKQALIDAFEREAKAGYLITPKLAIEIINKHLPDNMVSVPVEPTEAMLEASKYYAMSDYRSDRLRYKAMLQAHKGE